MLTEDRDFRYLRESAQRVGVDIDADPPTVERMRLPSSQGHLSALRWGAGPVRTVAVHGGGQNAHTWDSFAMALGRPLLAVDLPGHGHSMWREDRRYLPQANAAVLAEALTRAGLTGIDYVGMSLGGLTGIALAAQSPNLVRRLIVIDVTPGIRETYDSLRANDRGATSLVMGRRVFESFEAMVDAAAATAPSRTRDSMRIGTYYNAKENPDGTWSWRYDHVGNDDRPAYQRLWDQLSAIEAPVLLVRGGRSGFVSDDDAARFVRVTPGARVVTVPNAGHSVQGDQPAALARVVRDFLAD